MTVDRAIHNQTNNFLRGLSSSLSKETNGRHEILKDPSLQTILHIVSCAKFLKDKFDVIQNSASNGVSAQKRGQSRASTENASIQLFQPVLNGILALLGKMLMDSFSIEPKVTDADMYAEAYGVLGRHILTQFPEMTAKKHKSSGKMLIHHAVFKARPSIAEETVKQILQVSPVSARAADALGALPLHWAMRNNEIAYEVLNLLLNAYPDGPRIADKKGFLPLHWAVNQDQPNVEIVRRLLKIYPQAAMSASNSGNLPLHYCVSRARPSIPVIKALVTVYPDAVKQKCEDGFLPLHRFLHRPIVDLEALRVLINFFPESLMSRSDHNQLPLHVALDNSMPDVVAVNMLLDEAPEACKVSDSDGYLPLHLILDSASPDYDLANRIMALHPDAAQHRTNDSMLPLHLVVGSNDLPDVSFVEKLVKVFPEALTLSVKDIIPASEGEALADPESWSGEWVETEWTPPSRAAERGFTLLVQLFSKFQAAVQHPSAFVAPQPSISQQQEHPHHMDHAVPVKNQPLHPSHQHHHVLHHEASREVNFFNNGNRALAFEDIEEIDDSRPTSPDIAFSGVRDFSRSGMVQLTDDDLPVLGKEGVGAKGNSEAIPQHILKAQKQAISRNSSSGTDVSSPAAGGAHNAVRQRTQQQHEQGSQPRASSPINKVPSLEDDYGERPKSSPATGANKTVGRAPPPGPIPTSLLLAAESNALKYAKAQADFGRTRSKSASTDRGDRGSTKSKTKVSSRYNRDLGDGSYASSVGLDGGGSLFNNSTVLDQQSRNGSTTLPVINNDKGAISNNAGRADEPHRVLSAPPVRSVNDTKAVPAKAWDEQNGNTNLTAAQLAKQQRLLAAQQQYVKRVGGKTAANVDDTGLNPRTLKVAQNGNNGMKNAPFNKAAPTNNTNEIIKNMGGNVRIHTVTSAGGRTNGRSSGDEMV